MKILIVEDDDSTNALLSQLLLAQHYVVDVTTDGQTGLELATAWEYDLIVLDWMIPGLDGVSVCRRLREQGDVKPILLLTSKDQDNDIIAGLDAGADDYVTKPFQAETLLARIRALLRRGQGTATDPRLKWGDLYLDPMSADVTYAAQPLALTPKEYTLLELFLRNPKRVFSRSGIIDRLWSVDASPSESAVTNLIKDLRQKLRKAGLEEDIIETVYGLGYRLKPWADAADGAAVPAPVDLSAQVVRKTAAAGATPSKNLQQTLERFRPTLLQQVAALAETLADLGRHSADLSLRDQAETLAHKLAGSLGTFGYDPASHLAREIEQSLVRSQPPSHRATAPPLSAFELAHLAQLMGQLKAQLHQTPLAEGGARPLIPTSVPRILVVDDDVALGQSLKAEAPFWGLQLDYLVDPHQVWAHLQTQSADAVLLNLDIQPLIGAPDRCDGLALLQALRQDYPLVPVMVLTHRDALEDRITVARLGGCAYLHKPMALQDILQTVAQILAQPQAAHGSILVVDDDPVSLAAIRKVLQPWGLHITSLQDATRFWEELTTTRPHLLILDIEMPTFSGLELCRVVRQDPNWRNLPILVVTSHTDQPSLTAILGAGADECLAKPIVAADLVTRAIHWLGRIHGQAQLEIA